MASSLQTTGVEGLLATPHNPRWKPRCWAWVGVCESTLSPLPQAASVCPCSLLCLEDFSGRFTIRDRAQAPLAYVSPGIKLGTTSLGVQGLPIPPPPSFGVLALTAEVVRVSVFVCCQLPLLRGTPPAPSGYSKWQPSHLVHSFHSAGRPFPTLPLPALAPGHFCVLSAGLP